MEAIEYTLSMWAFQGKCSDFFSICALFVRFLDESGSRSGGRKLLKNKKETLDFTWKSKVSRVGGDKRDRTADLLNAIQALSQLSYTPISEQSI